MPSGRGGRKWMRTMAGAWTLIALTATFAAAAERVFAPEARPQLLWGEGEFTEGVAAAPDGTIYFSDIPAEVAGRILKFDPATGQTTVFSADSGKSNGLCFDRDGRLLAACGANDGAQAVCVFSADGRYRPLVSKFDGKRLNAPNDLDIHPRGWVFFSDPRYVGPEPIEIDHLSVYRFDPATGEIVRATTNISKPNGVVVSPDGKTLYVAETDNGSPNVPGAGSGGGKKRMTLDAFPIDAQGNLGEKRVLKDFGQETGIDGMTVDSQGRIFAAVRAESRPGVGVFSPVDGAEIDFLPLAELPTNCSFGRGDSSSTLYITAGKSLYRIPVKAKGSFAF